MWKLRKALKENSACLYLAQPVAVFKTLGNPKIKDASWDAYQTNYGTLILIL